MALASELQTRMGIVATMRLVTGIGAVYPRVRRPIKEGTDAEYKKLYVDEDGKVNFWSVRRVQRVPVVTEFNHLVSVTQVYSLVGHFGVVDDDDDALASEAVFQLMIEEMAKKFDENLNLGGLGGVSHRGLAVPNDITDVLLGAYLCHRSECRLIVEVEDC